MKKIKKLLMSITTLTTLGAMAAPLASCSNKDEGAKANLTVTSSDGVTIKESSVELNKDSTVTLNVPNMKAISTMYINVGSTVLTEDKDFTLDYDNNIVKINASAMTNKDVNMSIFTTQMNGIKASLAESKTFESLETIKASDIVITPTYEQETKAAKPLTYGSDYLVYDDKGSEYKNFDTVGYQLTRLDADNGKKAFIFEYISNKEWTASLDVSVIHRIEPKKISDVECDDEFMVGDTIKASDIKVIAEMTRPEGSKKELVWGSDYKILDNGTEINEFDTKGYTFTKSGENNLTIRPVEHPEAVYSLIIDVEPIPVVTGIQSVNVCDYTIKTEKITADSVAVVAELEAPVGATKILKWGTEYEIYDGDTKIDNFDTDGYTFNNEGSQVLTIKTINTEQTYTKNVVFTVQPESYKNSVVLTNTGEGDAQIKLVKGNGSEKTMNLEYYNGTDWTTISYDSPIDLPENNTLLLRGNNPNGWGNWENGGDSIRLTSKDANTPADVKLYGSILNLINYTDHSAITLQYYAFNSLFALSDEDKDLAAITSVSPSFLGDHTFDDEGIFQRVFENNTRLTSTPIIPNKQYSGACFNGIFRGCSSLVKAPKLSADVLEWGCYNSMFAGCTSLKEMPELPATKRWSDGEAVEGLPTDCYCSMFSGCTSLNKLSTLPATILGSTCYRYMFQNCTSLTKAPKLSATKTIYRNNVVEGLPIQCYQNMFEGCTSLKKAPSLPSTIISEESYQNMFLNCKSLKKAPELPATKYLSKGVATDGLAYECYNGMFSGCIALTQCPELPATKLGNNCYWEMFSGCSSLSSAPSLPATTLTPYCYNCMFLGCTNLKINNTGSEGTLFFTCPSSFDDSSIEDMFSYTGGTFKGTPAANGKYYWY